MDTSSPLMQALRTEHGASIDRGNTGEMTAVMSYDQVSYLLTVMVTVSVVSILILIFSVTLILGFLWYTRNLLHSAKCGCPGLPSSSSANVNIPRPGLPSGHQPQQWRHGGPGHPHHQLGHGARGQGVLLYSSDKLHRPSKHVTVNPLPPPTLPAINSAHRRLVPSIKQSSRASERSSDNSISSADEINHTSSDEKTGNETAEPIYAEIRAKEIKDDQHQPEKSSSESESKQNKSEQNEQHQELSGKKEIEYWQITAKEVVKFRPCTETFIVRE